MMLPGIFTVRKPVVHGTSVFRFLDNVEVNMVLNVHRNHKAY